MRRALGPATATTERAEFDVVALPSGETRMYVGVGGGGVVRALPAQRQRPHARGRGRGRRAGSTLTSAVPDTPGYSSFGYCDPQCSYDNYVYVPPGADADTVYLSGANEYNENNWGPNSPFCCPTTRHRRSNGRAVLLSTNAGATFTDMTEDKPTSAIRARCIPTTTRS